MITQRHASPHDGIASKAPEYEADGSGRQTGPPEVRAVSRARGTGSAGAAAVRFCHRPAAGLLVTSAPGTFRYRGGICRDVRRLGRGQRAAFTVHAIAAARAAGRTLKLRATATAPGARTAFGADRIAVIAQSFAGTGRG
jgi:hypothetical protein